MDLILTLFFSIKIMLFALLAGSAVFPELLRNIKGVFLLVLLGFFSFSLIVLAIDLGSLSNRVFMPFLYLLVVMGCVRLFIEWRQSNTFPFLKEKESGDRKAQLRSVLFIFISCLPIFVFMLTSAFDTNDEIYSWNFWARQFFIEESPSFVYTQAVYPQGFSSLLTGFYHISGSLEYQAAAKLSLAILVLIVFSLIAFSGKNSKHILFLYFLIIMYLYQLDLDKQFQLALADPLMGVYLVAALYSVLSLTKSHYLSVSKALIIASLFFSAAALTKQTAIPWAIVFGPLMIFQSVRAHNLPTKNIIIAFIPAFVGVLWLLTSGLGFHANDGVVNASFQNRDLITQVQFSLNKYFIEQPVLLVLLLFFSWSVLRAKFTLLITAYLGCLVSLCLWLVFGAYDFRLGMHIYLILFLLFMHTPLYNNISLRLSSSVLSNTKLASVLFFLILVGATAQSVKIYKKNSSAYANQSSTLGFNMQITKLMGKRANSQIDTILSEEKHKVLTTTNYHYGALYTHVNLAKPIYLGADIAQLSLQQLARKNITHVFLSSDRFAFGSLNLKLKSLITSCPAAFQPFTYSDNYSGFQAYKFFENALCEVTP